MTSKRRQRRRECEGKQTHATEESAIAHVRSLRQRFDFSTYHHYRCGFCGKWHVGRMRGTNMQRVRAKRGDA